jgi:hypothetical protein
MIEALFNQSDDVIIRETYLAQVAISGLPLRLRHWKVGGVWFR